MNVPSFYIEPIGIYTQCSENCVKAIKGEYNGVNIHHSSSTAAFDQINPPSLRRKRPFMPSSLTTVDVITTAITTMPVPVAIPSHASVATIPAYVNTVTNNGYDINSSDGILEIIEMGSPPDATVAMSSLYDTINNALPWVQVSLQEEFVFAESPNTVLAI